MPTKSNLLALFFLFLMTANTVNATIPTIGNKPPVEKRDALTEDQKARIEVLKYRVTQIKAMDRSKLNKAERKELRQELKEIRNEVKEISGKTFVLALGGILIAILLLILLL
jgi:hypothetical protein